MKVLVTGAAGFVGKWVLKIASEEGYDVVGLDIQELGDHIYFDNNYFKYIKSSCQIDDLVKILPEFEGVVHLAAIRPTGDFGINEYIKNIKLASDVIEACRLTSINNLVLISSRSVYSNKDIPWKEEKLNIPLNLYGESKLAVDMLAEFYSEKYGMNIKSLRLAQVLGVGEKSGYLLNTFINRAFKKETLKLFGKGKGERQYIYVKDVAYAILAALEHKNIKGIFNIGIEETIKNSELGLIINRIFDNEGNLEQEINMPEDINIYKMDITKAKDVLEWKPRFTFEEALKDIKKIMENK
ncbi:NAD(P)-dependent oxidoreductase [Clostridium sp. SYSU_GA19001]|uniref:NAD-dependent epimerase/dehydratase family protein n=1 Tax=Clostridium caldaquaticum TaxID=2940653 RepID=UPI002076EB9A|nr:NAD(P)-dependent oxidoreductase [Clostridium caldaquaticum]MCM8710186.1 NAD(P)-dependent oxidoreductase [Clostridium caldaquaticum]